MATPTVTSKEEDYIKDFLTRRSINVENAYQQVLEDIITLLKNLFTRPVIIQTPNGDHLNLEFIVDNMKLITAPQYSVDNNPVNLNTLVEQQPRRRDPDKLTTMYNRLKNSINQTTTLDLPTEANIPLDNNITNLRNILKDLNSRRNSPRSQITYQCYLTGKVLLSLKNYQATVSEFLENVKNDVGFSKSYSYFLINFYLLGSEFIKLRTVTFPIRTMKTHFAYIKTLIHRDAALWR